MPGNRKPPPSPVKTAIIHTSLAVLTFAGVTGIGIATLMSTGNADLSAPREVVGLFTEPAQEPLNLKERLDDSHDAELHPATFQPEDHPEGPNLGVDDLHDETGDEPHDTPPEPTETAVITESPAGLPKAPFDGLTEWSSQGSLPVIAADGRTSFQAYRRPFSNPAGRPAISIVVGGLGLNSRVTQAAIDELPPEITLSFVVYSRGLQTWVDKARAAGHEVIIEMPMEPYDYPNNDTGPYTLLTTANASENLRRLEWLLSRATGYFAVSNYQGAKFATDSRAITPIFEELQKRGLAFIHDGSAPRSVFQTTANASSLPFAEAARVIDAEPSGGAIDEQLLHLEAIALQRGYALGTGFAFPITIDQLRDWSSTLSSKGYVLAPASSLPRSVPSYSGNGEQQQASP